MKKKIAILISGSNCSKVNEFKLYAGFNFDKHIEVLKNQFSDYIIDFYVVLSNDFDKTIFEDTLKGFKIISDRYLRQKYKIFRHSYQFLKRKYLLDLIDKNIDYYFFVFTRNDTFLVPYGEGLYTRTVKREQSAGWKKINKIDEKYYNLKLKFKDDIDLDKLYVIPYGYKEHISKNKFMWDGFALGNYDNIKTYLNFKINGNKEQPEIQIRSYLKQMNITLELIDEINDLKAKDNYLHMITHNRYGKKKRDNF